MPKRPAPPALNDRQRAYLVALVKQDLRAEQDQRAAARTWFAERKPASIWRAIEYGPRLSPDIWQDSPMRADLRAQGLVSEGSGSTWTHLERADLVVRTTRTVSVIVLGRAARVQVLHVQLTPAGRKLGRSLLPPAELPPVRDPAILSASAWRILCWAYYGRRRPCGTVDAWWKTGGDPPGPLVLKGLTTKLAKLGLVASDNYSTVQMLEAGADFVRSHAAEYVTRYPYSRRWLEIYEQDHRPPASQSDAAQKLAL